MIDKDQEPMEILVYTSVNQDGVPLVVTQYDDNTLPLDANEARAYAQALMNAADALRSNGAVH
jgi:hypothetical protein